MSRLAVLIAIVVFFFFFAAFAIVITSPTRAVRRKYRREKRIVTRSELEEYVRNGEGTIVCHDPMGISFWTPRETAQASEIEDEWRLIQGSHKSGFTKLQSNWAQQIRLIRVGRDAECVDEV